MESAIIAALIALLGGVASVAASSAISLRQLKIEQRKLRNEYIHLYLEKVFEKRLETYPQLFEDLVKIIQKINLRCFTLDELKKIGKILIEWDAKNAIFMSASSQQSMHRLYQYFDKLSCQPDEELQKLIEDEENLYQLKKRLLNFNLELKNDLGIYLLDSFSVITGEKSPISQREVDIMAQPRKFSE